MLQKRSEHGVRGEAASWFGSTPASCSRSSLAQLLWLRLEPFLFPALNFPDVLRYRQFPRQCAAGFVDGVADSAAHGFVAAIGRFFVPHIFPRNLSSACVARNRSANFAQSLPTASRIPCKSA